MSKYYNVHYENGGNVTLKKEDSFYCDTFFVAGYFKNVQEKTFDRKIKIGKFRNESAMIEMKNLSSFPTYVMEQDGIFYDVITGEEVQCFLYADIIKNQEKLAFCDMYFEEPKVVAEKLRSLTEEDVERYMRQFEKAKQNAKREYEKYLEEKQKKYVKTRNR